MWQEQLLLGWRSCMGGDLMMENKVIKSKRRRKCRRMMLFNHSNHKVAMHQQ